MIAYYPTAVHRYNKKVQAGMKMRESVYLPRKERQQVLALFFLGFVLGIIVSNLWLKGAVDEGGIMSQWFLTQFSYTEIQTSQLFWYVLERRAKTFCLLAVVGITGAGNVLLVVCLLWSGICVGGFFSVCIMQMGILGLLLAVTSLFPQIFMYVPLIFLLLKLIGNRKEVTQNRGERKQRILVCAAILLLSVVILIVGICMESYINPVLLRKVINCIN